MAGSCRLLSITVYITGVWMFVVAVPASGATPLGTGWTYQAWLKQNGDLVNGICACEFTLWDDPVGGTQVGPTLTFDGAEGNPAPITVVDGLFAVELDFGAQAASKGDTHVLEIAVACPPGEVLETLSPRQPITAAPYALYALDGPGAGSTPWQTSGSNIFYSDGNVGIGTSSPGSPLHVETDGVDPSILGHHTATSLTRVGVAGQSDSTGGRGVFGNATSPTGLNTGVWGQTSSDSGRGVLGIAAAGDGTTRGVYGQSNSTSGTGVYGFGLAVSGSTRGIHGEVNSPDGYAGYFEGGRNYFEGNVGVGTQTPGAKLHVSTGDSGATPSGNATLALESDGGNFLSLLAPDATLQGIRFGNPVDGDNAAAILYDANLTPGGLQIHTGGDPPPARLTIDATGNVGINTQFPSERLHVNGNARVDGDLHVEGDITMSSATRTLMISALAFEHENDFGDLDVVFAGSSEPHIRPGIENVHTLGNRAKAGTAVLLPHGAVITEVAAWMYDGAPSHNLTVSMKRELFGTNTVNTTLMAQVVSSGSSGNQEKSDTTVSSATVDNNNYVYWVEAVWPQGTEEFDLRLFGIKIMYEVTTPLP